MKKLFGLLLSLAAIVGITGCKSETKTEIATCSTLVEEAHSEESVRPDETVDGTTVTIGNTTFNGDFHTGWTNSSYDNNVRKLVYDTILRVNKFGELVTSNFVESLTREGEIYLAEEYVVYKNISTLEYVYYDATEQVYRTFDQSLITSETEAVLLDEGLGVNPDTDSVYDGEVILEGELHTHVRVHIKSEGSLVDSEGAVLTDLTDYDATTSSTDAVPLTISGGFSRVEWVLEVKDGYTFSSGNALDNQAIAEIYEYYLDEEAFASVKGSTSMPTYLDTAVAEGDNEVVFYATQDLYTIKSSLFTSYLIDIEYYQEKADNSTYSGSVHEYINANRSDAKGSGPYTLVEYKTNEYVKLTANSSWGGKKTYSAAGVVEEEAQMPAIENINIMVVSDETEIDQLLAGDIDIIAGVVEDTKIDAAKQSDSLVCSNYLRHGYGHVTFHNDFGVASDVNVRKAIAYSIDREVFRALMLGKYGEATEGPYSTNFWMIDDEFVEENLEIYSTNVEKVNELLSTDYEKVNGIWTAKHDIAGTEVKAGDKLELKLVVGATSWADPFNTVLANLEDDFGISIEVVQQDFSILLEHYYGNVSEDDREYHMFALATSLSVEFDGYTGWHSDYVVKFGTGSSYTTSRWVNEYNDALLEIMRQATVLVSDGLSVSEINDEYGLTGSDYALDTTIEYTNDALYQEAYLTWVELTNDELPLIPMYSNDYHDLYNSRIRGFSTNPLYDWTNSILDSWID